MKHTVKSLRQSGIKIRVNHMRALNGKKELIPIRTIRDKKLQSFISPYRGKTIIEATTKDGKDYTAECSCYALDHFNRHIGLETCIERLAKQLGI